MKVIAFVMPWHISERGGGAEVQADYLAQELAERGFLVSYICQTTKSSKINAVEAIGNIKVYYLKASGRFPWLDQNKYLKPLQKIQPDFILQRLSSNVTYTLGKYCSQNKCKLVWFCTDNKSPFRDFHYSNFKKQAALKSLGLVKQLLFGGHSILMDYYRNKGMAQVNIAFTQNNFQKENLKTNFNLKSFRMISGHPAPYYKIQIAERFNYKTVLWCANLGKHKRPELFIELASKMQNTDLKFIMVGGHSDKSYESKLFKNRPPNLEITGNLSFDEALNYFEKTSVFINTSFSEGFSNTYIQSWLREIPTVVFGADPDAVIVQNSLGYNVSGVEEAIEKINGLFKNEDKYKQLANNAYKYAIENHSIKKMTDNFLKMLSKI